MRQQEFLEIVDLIRKESPRYGRGAYVFLREALDYTLKKNETTAGKGGAHGKGRHVNGRDLLEGIREYAIERFGPMVLTVFEDWNIRQGSDFGVMVFQLVDYGVLGKTDEDKLADFEGGYGFEEAFRKPFIPSMESAHARCRDGESVPENDASSS